MLWVSSVAYASCPYVQQCLLKYLSFPSFLKVHKTDPRYPQKTILYYAPQQLRGNLLEMSLNKIPDDRSTLAYNYRSIEESPSLTYLQKGQSRQQTLELFHRCSIAWNSD